MPAPNPLLLYDGDCAFCVYWVRYWQRLTGSRIEYHPYQELVDQIDGLSVEECRRAVQLIMPDGRRWSGARASFEVLRHGGSGVYAAAYAHSDRFARKAERMYAFVAGQRARAFVAARLLWGSERHPARYDCAARVFVRTIALIYLAAFASLATQVIGLLGHDGILPAGDLLDAAARAWPDDAWFQLPTVFWWTHDDQVLRGVCVAGVVAAAIAAIGRLVTPMLLLCYTLYLSLYAVGQDFLAFQWDLLLLEAGFLSLWLALPGAVVPFLFRLLLFRFMFLSGCVKLLSGDPSWSTLAALDFHYETQPLPTPLAWYAHQLPAWFDRACTAALFVVELALPFLIFTPRRPRMLAAGGILLLQACIVLTGNYNFFNLLTMALCLFLFDDAQLRRGHVRQPPQSPRLGLRVALMAMVAVVLLHNAFYLALPFAGRAMPAVLSSVLTPFAPFRIVNGYGLFAVMTTTRREIEIEGSRDGRAWLAYEFRDKPGDPQGPLRWIIPHQPRLDWQMWFAALANADSSPWFGNLLLRLLQNAPAVTALLRHNPFADEAPRYVRALLYEYHFTSRAERRDSGRVWRRELLGLYYPPTRLK